MEEAGGIQLSAGVNEVKIFYRRARRGGRGFLGLRFDGRSHITTDSPAGGIHFLVQGKNFFAISAYLAVKTSRAKAIRLKTVLTP
jgi:hypothetical protein